MMDFSIKVPSFRELKPFHQYWTWQEIQWGKINGLIYSQDVISYAVESLEEDREDFSVLLSLSIETSNSDNIDQEIAALCCFEEKESIDQIALVWRKVILKWLYNNIKGISDLQQSVDALYADFDYPKDMRPLIGYMPVQAGQQNTNWDIKKVLREYLEQ